VNLSDPGLSVAIVLSIPAISVWACLVPSTVILVFRSLGIPAYFSASLDASPAVSPIASSVSYNACFWLLAVCTT
jgi:hypothetical protein